MGKGGIEPLTRHREREMFLGMSQLIRAGRGITLGNVALACIP